MELAPKFDNLFEIFMNDIDQECIVAEEALPIILSIASSCFSLKYLIIAERINSLGSITVSTLKRSKRPEND
ncbi:10557_t:CDS:2 [Diversispora eburnea]|uniref:10557_t:CDS:1 n=1 Tax=Diversispora eburnea TaxID=1213867 RepID=A0A9N9FEN2_9GLOM|nr:10557_t:CDS:2 [Diversispora eburnea]